MRLQKMTSYLLPILLLGSCTALAGQPAIPENEMTADANYDEVVRDLVSGLTKDKVTAQDAALKLARLGKRSIPVLTEVLKANYTPPPPPSKDSKDPPKTLLQKGNPTLAYYSALALSRIRMADAARPLLPLLANPNTTPDLRNMAIESLGLEFLPEAGVALQKIAAEDPDAGLRKKAINQLMIMPNFWIASENLFVAALSDPDEEIRSLAAKQCSYARVYMTAVDKLIELSEKDAQTMVRVNAMLALSRMKIRKAVPALTRICANKETPSNIMPTALRTLNVITGVALKDGPAVQTWWQKFGEAEYAKLEAPPKEPEKPKDDSPVPEKKEP